jgi:hypothetical protein
MAAIEGPSEAWYREAFMKNPELLFQMLEEAGVTFYSSDGQMWKEYNTPAGRIDLLVALPNVLIVIEFKRDIADESAVAQCLRYMGALESVGVETRGVVAASGFTKGALWAASAARLFCISLDPMVSFTSHEALDLNDPISEVVADELQRVCWPEIYDGSLTNIKEVADSEAPIVSVLPGRLATESEASTTVAGGEGVVDRDVVHHALL